MNTEERALWTEFNGFRYPASPHATLGQISMSIAQGEIVAIMGSSGSGKTTLLKICAELSGFNLLEGQVTKSGRFAILFQQNLLLDHLTVKENIQLPVVLLEGETNNDIREQEMLMSLGLQTALLERYPFQLSGGQQKRVAIARALSYPNLSGILMDEPFVGIDEPQKEDIIADLITWLTKTHLACLLTTHDPIAAVLLADRILFLGSEPAIIVHEHSITIPRSERLVKFQTPEFFQNIAEVRSWQLKAHKNSFPRRSVQI